jgi:hypothetical protein
MWTSWIFCSNFLLATGTSIMRNFVFSDYDRLRFRNFLDNLRVYSKRSAKISPAIWASINCDFHMPIRGSIRSCYAFMPNFLSWLSPARNQKLIALQGAYLPVKTCGYPFPRIVLIRCTVIFRYNFQKALTCKSGAKFSISPNYRLTTILSEIHYSFMKRNRVHALRGCRGDVGIHDPSTPGRRPCCSICCTISWLDKAFSLIVQFASGLCTSLPLPMNAFEIIAHRMGSLQCPRDGL